MTHICVGKLTIIASDNGLSPGRRQAIIWTNAGILLIRPLAINFSEILIKIQIFSLKKMYLKLSSAKWRLLRLGLNLLIEGMVDCYRVSMSWLSPKYLFQKSVTFSTTLLLTTKLESSPHSAFNVSSLSIVTNFQAECEFIWIWPLFLIAISCYIYHRAIFGINCIEYKIIFCRWFHNWDVWLIICTVSP